MVYLLQSLAPKVAEGPGLAHSGAFVGSNPTVYTILIGTERHVMKKALLVLVGLSISLLSHAGKFTDDPYELFNADKKMTGKTTIEWKTSNDINATCDAESRKRGLGGFGQRVYACSFWDKSMTGHTIFTGKKTDMHQLGHETRHCFVGTFH